MSKVIASNIHFNSAATIYISHDPNIGANGITVMTDNHRGMAIKEESNYIRIDNNANIASSINVTGNLMIGSAPVGNTALGSVIPYLRFGGAGGNVGITYSVQKCDVELFPHGNMITVHLALTNKGSNTGQAQVVLTGLPGQVNIEASGPPHQVVNVGYWKNFAANVVPTASGQGLTYILRNWIMAVNAGGLTNVHLSNTSEIIFSCWHPR